MNVMSFFSGRRQQQDEVESTPAPPKPTASTPPPAPRQPIGFETVLGATTTLEGAFRGQGNMRLDGILEGTLEIDGNILIGETARITADINARNISIAGAVHGNVNGNKVQILRTGRVWGDISAAAITTEEGAFIDGKITMVRHEAALQSGEAAALPEPAAEPDFMAQVDAEREEEAEIEEETVEGAYIMDDGLPEEDADLVDDLLEDDDERTMPLNPADEGLPVDDDGAIG
jgi:cytoskeletal protein CcmA (bactofilin family)